MLTYETDTWAMKAENLHSLERTDRMMVRWMCGVSLKDKKRSVDLYFFGYKKCDSERLPSHALWLGTACLMTSMMTVLVSWRSGKN